MSIFTIHRVAGLHKASAVVAFAGVLYLLFGKLVSREIRCKVDNVEEKCLSSLNYNSSSEASEIISYGYSQYLWLNLLVAIPCSSYLWWIWSHRRPTNGIRLTNYLKAVLEESRFTHAKAFSYLALCLLYLIGEFGTFQFMLGGRFADFPVAWLVDVYRGKILLHVTCVIGRDPLSKLVTTTTCELPRNIYFEFTYLVLWFWLMLLAVVNVICLLRYLLFTFSSTLRVMRLKVLLKGVDEQQISALAEDVEVFFKLESCAGEIEQLKRQQLLNAVLSPKASDSPSKVVSTK